MNRSAVAVFMVSILLSPLIGSISASSDSHQVSDMADSDIQKLGLDHTEDAPLQALSLIHI